MKGPHGSLLTGLVLAGGAGRRMGGVDKGWIDWRGRPLIAHTLDRLLPQVDTVMISANRSLDRYRAFGHPVVTDARPDYPGPLAGIEAGLRAATTPWVLYVPCDNPALPPGLATALVAAVERGAPAACWLAGGRWQPVHGLVPRAAVDGLSRQLDLAHGGVLHWLEALGAVGVGLPDTPEAPPNLNTPPPPGH